MINEYDFWLAALRGDKVDINEDAPQSGFWRMRRHKDGPWLPVMIRMHDGRLRCRVGDDSGADAHDTWVRCAKYPVSKEDAKVAFETGAWPSDAPLSNSANATPLELLTDYIATASAWFAGKTLNTQRLVDEAANYATELLRLKAVADKERDSLVRPHLEAQREINGKYKPAIDDADNLAKMIKRATDDFLRAEKARREAEARAKYEAERRAAEIARQEVEKARAKQLIDDPIAALTSTEPELPAMPAPPEPVKVQAGGQRGRKMGLRTYTEYVVDDHAAALAFFADHEKVRDLVKSLATMACKANVQVPGVRIVQEERAA